MQRQWGVVCTRGGKLDSHQSCSYSRQNQELLGLCCGRRSKLLQVGQSPAAPTAAVRVRREGGSAALKQKCLLKKTKKHSKQPIKNPKLRFVGETTSFLPRSISVLMLGLLSAPLSAPCTIKEDGPLPPCTAHNGCSMGSL